MIAPSKQILPKSTILIADDIKKKLAEKRREESGSESEGRPLDQDLEMLREGEDLEEDESD